MSSLRRPLAGAAVDVPTLRQWSAFSLWVLRLTLVALLLVAMIGVTMLLRQQRDGEARVLRQLSVASDALDRAVLGALTGGALGSAGPAESAVLLRDSRASLVRIGKSLSPHSESSQALMSALKALDEGLAGNGSAGEPALAGTAVQGAVAQTQRAVQQVSASLAAQHASSSLHVFLLRLVDLALAFVFLAVGALAFRAADAWRRSIQLSLEERDALFDALVEQAPVGITIQSGGELAYANPSAVAMVGSTPENLIGGPIFRFLVEEERAAASSVVERLRSGELSQHTGIYHLRREDGQELALEIHSSVAWIHGEGAVASVLRDVTQVRRNERERLEALQLLESIAVSSDDVLIAKDTQGRYIYANRKAAMLLGRTREEVIGRDDHALFPAHQADRNFARDREVMHLRQVLNYDVELTTVQGLRTLMCTTGPLYSSDGQVMGVFVNARDITERRAHQAELDESRSQLVAVVDALEEGLLVLDPQGRLIHINAAALRITGADAARLSNLPYSAFSELFDMETLDGKLLTAQERPIARLLRGEQFRNLELVSKRRDGAWRRIVSLSGAQIRSSLGELRLVVLTFVDVTLRRHAEEGLLRVQRMEALGSLAAGIAHDFNNLLLAISGNLSLARADLSEEHPARESLEEVDRASRRAVDLVKRILMFSRVEEAKRHVVQLPVVVDEALQLLRPTLPAYIEVHVHAGLGLPAVYADPSQIHQVIVNLVTNSVQAIAAVPDKRHGSITIEMGPAASEMLPELFAAGTSPAGVIRLAVSDDGCGMSAVVLARAFDPFYTTKAVGQGTGLGLSMVHGIVQRHGGLVTARSEPDKGCCIEVYLPATLDAPAEQAPSGAQPAQGGGRRILYLDDEESLVFLVSRYLRRLGYVVTGCTRPSDAVSRLAARPQDFDLVVTDLSMPEMSGFDVVRAVRRLRPGLPVILMSGYLRPEDRELARELGIDDVLLKPSTVEELGETIDRQLH